MPFKKTHTNRNEKTTTQITLIFYCLVPEAEAPMQTVVPEVKSGSFNISEIVMVEFREGQYPGEILCEKYNTHFLTCFVR